MLLVEGFESARFHPLAHTTVRAFITKLITQFRLDCLDLIRVVEVVNEKIQASVASLNAKVATLFKTIRRLRKKPTVPGIRARRLKQIAALLPLLLFGACSLFATPQETMKDAATSFSQTCADAAAKLGDQAVQCTPEAFANTAIQIFGGAVPTTSGTPAPIEQAKPAEPAPAAGAGVIKIYQ